MTIIASTGATKEPTIFVPPDSVSLDVSNLGLTTSSFPRRKISGLTTLSDSADDKFKNDRKNYTTSDFSSGKGEFWEQIASALGKLHDPAHARSTGSMVERHLEPIIANLRLHAAEFTRRSEGDISEVNKRAVVHFLNAVASAHAPAAHQRAGLEFFGLVSVQLATELSKSNNFGFAKAS